MLRTIFSIGIFTLLGLFALRLAFGILGFAFGIFGVLLALTVKIAIIGGVGYLVLRIVAPGTLRKLSSRSD
ncbi:MAG TPA: hypothetical protein VE967_20235 [Gemmatimonadaceae bacterium]|nr:hypothetical protein [Gemmatimonadaceae bacterium]